MMIVFFPLKLKIPRFFLILLWIRRSQKLKQRHRYLILIKDFNALYPHPPGFSLLARLSGITLLASC